MSIDNMEIFYTRKKRKCGKLKINVTSIMWVYIWVYHICTCLTYKYKQSMEAPYLCYKPQLLNIIFSGEQRFPRCNFTKYATNRPDINCRSVLWTVKKQLRCSIPTSDNIFSHEISLRCCSCQSEVSDLKVTICIKKQIAGLKITVQNIRRVHIFQTTK